MRQHDMTMQQCDIVISFAVSNRFFALRVVYRATARNYDGHNGDP